MVGLDVFVLPVVAAVHTLGVADDTDFPAGHLGTAGQPIGGRETADVGEAGHHQAQQDGPSVHQGRLSCQNATSVNRRWLNIDDP